MYIIQPYSGTCNLGIIDHSYIPGTWWLITLGVQYKPCLWCIYIGLQYCNNTVGYSYNTLLRYKTDTECTRAIASTLIHAVVLCESAQRYRALMVFLQSHI